MNARRSLLGACLSLALLLIFSPLSQAEEWTVYQNARFGFVIPIPPGLIAQEPPANGAGQIYLSPDREIQLITSAGFNVDQLSDVETYWKSELSVPGRNITYQRKTNTWFVLSGIEADGKHFYLRHTANANYAATWLITYPAKDDQKVSAWIERIAKGYEARLGQGFDTIED